METKPKWSDHTKDLLDQGVLEEWLDHVHRPHVYANYFGVRKGRTKKARAIFSCRRLNAMVKKPPPFEFVNHSRIMRALKVLDWKDPKMATSDYKNYYYQHMLPKCVRPFFAIIMKGATLVCRVMAMGYNWSPWMGQGVTCAVLYKARKVFAERYLDGAVQDAIPNKCFESVIYVKDKNGKVVAFMSAVLDNLLVVAPETELMEKAVSCVEEVNREFNIHVKVGEKQVKEPRLPEGWVSNTEKEVGAAGPRRSLVYLGVEYINVPNNAYHPVQFRHARDNVKGWREDFEYFAAQWRVDGGHFDCQRGKRMTNRQVAHMLGLRIWDCTVRQVPLSSMPREMEALSFSSKRLFGKEDWNAPTDLSFEEQARLVASHERFLMEAEKVDTHHAKFQNTKKEKIYICADSSKRWAAGVILRESGDSQVIKHTVWRRKQTFDRSINWKETKIAVETINELLERWDELVGPDIRKEEVEIIFGEDNTTAMCSLNTFRYNREQGLCKELYQLWLRLQKEKMSLNAFHIRSKQMPADDPSREQHWTMEKEESGKPEGDKWQKKCKVALDILKEAAGTKATEAPHKRGKDGRR